MTENSNAMNPTQELTDSERLLLAALVPVASHRSPEWLTLMTIRSWHYILSVYDLVTQDRWSTSGHEHCRWHTHDAASIAHVAGSLYRRVTGKAPGRSRNHDNGRASGFIPFLAAIFRALGIKASADNHAKAVARSHRRLEP